MRKTLWTTLSLTVVAALMAGCGVAEPEGYEAGDIPEAVEASREIDRKAEAAKAGDEASPAPEGDGGSAAGEGESAGSDLDGVGTGEANPAEEPTEE